MGAAKRRRRQAANGYAHLSRICGKNVVGGRPVYRRRTLLSVQDAIARERAAALAEQRRKAKK